MVTLKSESTSMTCFVTIRKQTPFVFFYASLFINLSMDFISVSANQNSDFESPRGSFDVVRHTQSPSTIAMETKTGDETERFLEVFTTSSTTVREQKKEEENVDVKLHPHNCTFSSLPVVGQRGRIRGMFGELNSTYLSCKWFIEVDEPSFMYVLVSMPEEVCLTSYHVDISLLDRPEALRLYCGSPPRHMLLFNEKRRNFTFQYTKSERGSLGIRGRQPGVPNFTFEFTTVSEDVRKILLVTTDTPMSGYVTPWGYDGSKNCLCEVDADHLVMTPEDHVVVLSFSIFDMDFVQECGHSRFWLYSTDSSGVRDLIFRACGQAVIPAEVHLTSLYFAFRTREDCGDGGTGFKAYFSFHAMAQKPQKVDVIFNCSTPIYTMFKKHLECNLEYECDKNQDEGEHCPYSNSKCKGFVSSGVKCYEYVLLSKPVSFLRARKVCRDERGDLAMVKTLSEWNDLRKLFRFGKRFQKAWIGLYIGASGIRDIYMFLMKWIDNSVDLNVHVLTKNIVRVPFNRDDELCAVVFYRRKFMIQFEKCKSAHKEKTVLNVICQYEAQKRQTAKAVFPVTSFPFQVSSATIQRFVSCYRGHVTHAILSCDYISQCQFVSKHLRECRLPVAGGSDHFEMAMFECDDGKMTLHYTLVCDFRRDCEDSSDETFCLHTDCTGFLCLSGQCVEKWNRCNFDIDCLDESDELVCADEIHPRDTRLVFPQLYRLRPPVTIDFSRDQTIIQTPLGESEACPNTHFQCNEPYCLPVYLYCNGVADCPNGEDEMECHLHSCTGFYRCRSSTVCVHAEHLCDGRPQCPQRDDEWICHMICPEPCLCQGHAFLCPGVFNLTLNPYLRYLDAAGSSMQPFNITAVVYLVWLSLARCGVDQVSEMNLPNLRILNLGHNHITFLRMNVFMPLINLKVLILSNNPILFISEVTESHNHSNLRTVDFSFTSLAAFSAEMLPTFPHITHLNISFCNINVILESGFSSLLHLKGLDLRGNPLNSYPLDMLKHQTQLQSVYADDYRFCCKDRLPQSAAKDISCISPRTDYFSSCEDLMHFVEHRVIMLVITFLAVMGNATSLVLKLCITRNALSSTTDFLLTNLNLMDLLMGVYAAIIVWADFAHREHYYSVRHIWTSSSMCKAASFIAMVSYEGTLLTLCFVAVRGFAITHFPKFTAKFRQCYAYAVCVLIWALSIAISLIHLLMPNWKSHGNTATCLSVPTSVIEKVYAFAMMAILPFILSCLACLGQLSVVWLKYNRDDHNLSFTERSLIMAKASRALPITALDCVRRLVFCVLVLGGHVGWITREKIQFIYTILVMSLSSAVNPLIYARGHLQEKQRQRAEQRLLKRLIEEFVYERNL